MRNQGEKEPKNEEAYARTNITRGDTIMVDDFHVNQRDVRAFLHDEPDWTFKLPDEFLHQTSRMKGAYLANHGHIVSTLHSKFARRIVDRDDRLPLLYCQRLC